MRSIPALVVLLGATAITAGGARADDPAPAAAPPPPVEAPGMDAVPAEPEIPVERVSLEVDVLPTGDAKKRLEHFFPAAIYAKFKGANPDPRKFLQDLAGSRANEEYAPDPQVGYDDAARAVVLVNEQYGAARNLGGGRWEIRVEDGLALTKSSPADAPRPVAVFERKEATDGGGQFHVEHVYALPAGATGASFDGATGRLTYALETKSKPGPALLSVSFRARDRLMTSMYKVYGLGTDFSAQWVGKLVLRNSGASVVRNVRIRHRLQGYGEWSPWTKHPELVPGGSIVDCQYPVLDASVAKIKTNTAANFVIEWQYDDAEGRRHEDDDSHKLVLLGINEFVFSNLTAGERFGSWQEEFNNAPFLAAWVVRSDPVIKQFAAMANKRAGGVGASTNDADARKVLAACYDLLRANDFTYQHPPALADRSVSFDTRKVQNVKYPRETIRDRSGTCIDLAILYAAMANAIGLRSRLALIPGHCFPIVDLPGGTYVGVETTGVGGGLRAKTPDAAWALAKGTEELEAAIKDGRVFVVDLQDLWTRGVSNPEFEDLPADILERWGMSEEGRGVPGEPDAPAEEPAAEGKADPLEGIWQGTLTETVAGRQVTYPARIGIERQADGGWAAAARAELELTDDAGESTEVAIVGVFAGKAEGGVLTVTAEKMQLVFAASKETREAPGQTLVCTVRDGRLVGKIGTAADGWTEFSFEREK